MNAARACLAAAGLLLACAVLPGPAAAVDRSLGAGVAKPAPSGAGWSADAKSGLTRDIDALLDAAPTLRGAHVGLIVIDTQRGTVLYARHADDAFQAASTLKLLTGSVALATLTPRFRFRTQALFDSASAMLVIHGGGDPLLRAADLDGLAQSVRAAGLAGGPLEVRVDASDFESVPYPPGWTWDDFPFYYAPVLSAASVEENVVHVTVFPGPTPGAPVSLGIAPPFEHVTLPNGCSSTEAIVVSATATTAARGAGGDVDVQRAGGCIVVSGSLPVGSEPQEIDAAVPSPVWYLGALARYALAQAGVTVESAGESAVSAAAVAPGSAPGVGGGARVVWTHDGEPLSDLLADLWWPSDNLVAELLLKAIGRQTSGVPGTRAHGADAERVWLAALGIDPATVTIIDGSGLSSYDRITPRALAAILQADWNGPFRDVVLDDLPLAGVRGSIAQSFTGSLAERRTFAKTGSFNHTRGLAGYLATLHHGALTFAWSVDDWMGTDPDLEALRARVLSRLIGD